MSHFPSTHLVTAFDSKKSQPLSGQRLSKIRYKTTAAQKAKHPSVCVSVPFVPESEVTGNIAALMPHIQALLESAQDGVIRSLYESSGGVMSAVQDADISVAACIGWLEAESAGTRLTKEFIESWFATNVAEYVTAIIAERLHYDGELTAEQDATVGKHVGMYRELYSMLAGGKTILQPNQIGNLLKVLDLVDTDEVGEKLRGRLVAMQNKPKIEDMLEL